MTERNYIDPSTGLHIMTTEDVDGNETEDWSDAHALAWCWPGPMPDWARRAGIEPTGEPKDET